MSGPERLKRLRAATSFVRSLPCKGQPNAPRQDHCWMRKGEDIGEGAAWKCPCGAAIKAIAKAALMAYLILSPLGVLGLNRWWKVVC